MIVNNILILEIDNMGLLVKKDFFDINKISEQSSDLPHMLPSELFFSKMVGKLGINNDDTVVAYDNSIFFSSARAWWMFKIFGHKNLRIIDGGFKAVSYTHLRAHET